MSTSELGSLAARHMRFQRELLALWRHTCGGWQAMDSGNWPAWVAERQRLVAAMAAEDGGSLAADTGAANVDPRAASLLAAFQELEAGTIAEILRLDRRVRQAARGRLATLSRKLRATGRAQMARREYGGRAGARGRLSRRG